MPFTPFVPFGLSAARAARLPSYDLTPEEEISLTRSLANKTLGGVSAVGNFLDIPGSAVRDIAAWENPFDQLLSPFSPENRTSGRDLLEQWGMVGRNRKGLDPGDVGGFGVEVAFDPWTYLSFGASAVARGGKAAKAAGIMGDDIARIASKKLGRTVGKREARIVTNMSDVMADNLDKVGAMELALGRGNAKLGKKLMAKEANKPLGSLLGYGLPFMETTAIAGIGKKSQAIARGLDKVGARIAASAPYRSANRLVNAKVFGASTKRLQDASPRLARAIDSGEAAGRGNVNEMIELGHQTGTLSPEGGEAIRHMLETGTADDLGPALQELMSNPNFNVTPESAQTIFDTWKNTIQSSRAAASEFGVAPNELRGIGFVPRAFEQKFADLYKRAGKTAIEGSAGTNMSRIDWLRDLPTRPINQLGKNPQITNLIDDAGGTVEEIADEIARQYGDTISPRYFSKDEWLRRERLSDDLTDLGTLSPEEVIRQVDEAIPGSNDRYQKLAKWLAGLKPEHREAGIFGNNLYDDMQRFHNKSAQALAKSRHATEILADPSVSKESPRQFEQAGRTGTVQVGARVGDFGRVPKQGGGYDIGKIRGTNKKNDTAIMELADGSLVDVPLASITPMRQAPGVANINQVSTPIRAVLKKLDMKLGDTEDGALKAIWQRRNPGRDPSEFTPEELYSTAASRVDNEIAADLTRVRDQFTSPESVDILGSQVRSITNWWKAWVTGTIRFHSRNTTSGQLQNFLKGLFDGRSVMISNAIVRGGVDNSGTLAKLPIVQQTAEQWVKRGISQVDPKALSNEDATNIFRSVLRQFDLTGKGQGEFAQTVGDVGRGTDTVFGQFAGGIHGVGTPVSGKRILRQLSFQEPGTTFNPFDVAGVGGRTETRFGPIAASKQVGEWGEGLNRIAPFIELMKQGVDPQTAKRIVDHTQIAYSGKNFTPLEQKMLQVFPFGKFMKGEAKFVAKELIERPGGRLGQTIRGTNALRGDQDRPIPPHIAGGLAIPLPSGPSGAPRFLAGAGLMHEDPLSLFTDPVSLGTELLSRTNPLIKAPLELATGQSFFQRGPMGGRPLEDLDPLVGRLLSNVTGDEELLKSLPTSVEVGLANSPLAPLLAHLRVGTDSRKGAIARSFNLLTGGRITDVSEGAQASMLQEALHREMKDAGGKAFTRVFFSKEDLAAMSPAEREKAVRLNALNKLLATEAKERKAAREKFLK